MLSKHNYAANYGNTGLLNSTAGVNYAFVPTLNGVTFQGAPFDSRKMISFASITDGLSSTLLLAEVVQTQGTDVRGLIWWGDASGFYTYRLPTRHSPTLSIHPAIAIIRWPTIPLKHEVSGSLPSMYGWRSRHAGVVGAVLCDGSVRFISDDVDLTLWRSLSTTQGSEVISGQF